MTGEEAQWIINLVKAGSNPEQAMTAQIIGPLTAALLVGDEFHIEGQPADVLWRVKSFEGPRRIKAA